MLDPKRQDDITGAGVGVGLVALILGAVALLASTVLTHPIWLVLMSALLLIGAIAVRLYLSNSLSH
jgi:hypothetical protein